MRLVEGLLERAHGVLVSQASGNRHVQLPDLRPVAGLDEEVLAGGDRAELGEAREQRVRLGLDLGERLVDACEVERARLRVAAARELGDDVGVQRAAGRQRSGGGRDERAPAAELARDRDDVQARRAAAGHDRHLARVDPLRDRDLADRSDDVLGGHRQRRLRGLVEAQPQRLGDVLLDRRPRGLRVERQAAAEEEVRVDPAEHHRRIRDGRLEAAAPVAGRPRVGPRAAGPDAKQPSGVDPDDRAAARSDRLDVDRADARDVADPAPAEPRLGGRADLAARDEPDVERRPARVADDEVALALSASSSRA